MIDAYIESMSAKLHTCHFIGKYVFCSRTIIPKTTLYFEVRIMDFLKYLVLRK